MSNLLNKPIVVWIHSGGVPIGIRYVGSYCVNDSIVHWIYYVDLKYSDEKFLNLYFVGPDWNL